MAVRGVSFGEQSWRSWCEAGARAQVPLFAAREELGALLAEQGHAGKTHDFFAVKKKPAGASSQKKPAGASPQKKPAGASSQKKPAAACVEITKVKVAKMQLKKFRRTAVSLKRTAL